MRIIYAVKMIMHLILLALLNEDLNAASRGRSLSVPLTVVMNTSLLLHCLQHQHQQESRVNAFHIINVRAVDGVSACK